MFEVSAPTRPAVRAPRTGSSTLSVLMTVKSVGARQTGSTFASSVHLAPSHRRLAHRENGTAPRRRDRTEKAGRTRPLLGREGGPGRDGVAYELASEATCWAVTTCLATSWSAVVNPSTVKPLKVLWYWLKSSG